MLNEQFTTSRGDRSGVRNVGIYISDGESTRDLELFSTIASVHNSGIEVGLINAYYIVYASYLYVYNMHSIFIYILYTCIHL